MIEVADGFLVCFRFVVVWRISGYDGPDTEQGPGRVHPRARGLHQRTQKVSRPERVGALKVHIIFSSRYLLKTNIIATAEA